MHFCLKATKNILIWQRIHPSIRDTLYKTCFLQLKKLKASKRKLACNNNLSIVIDHCVCVFYKKKSNFSSFQKQNALLTENCVLHEFSKFLVQLAFFLRNTLSFSASLTDIFLMMVWISFYLNVNERVRRASP